MRCGILVEGFALTVCIVDVDVLKERRLLSVVAPATELDSAHEQSPRLLFCANADV